jgi:2-polyprenyl-3-methyl-5-hydroxy-6-metoxy-1,4-benzoquinol methylase
MNSHTESKEVWVSGDSYEPYVGRWSRLVAKEFVRWLAIPEDSQWLDVGSGTGALSQTILEMANPKNVKGIDRSESYVEFARSRVMIHALNLKLEMHRYCQLSQKLLTRQSLAWY